MSNLEKYPEGMMNYVKKNWKLNIKSLIVVPGLK